MSCLRIFFLLTLQALLVSGLHAIALPDPSPEHVYHASSVQKLQVLKPHESTHEKDWVYATPDPAIAASFLIRAGDFHFAKVMDASNRLCIVERYERAFGLYLGAKGSVYRLSSNGFLSGQTSWDSEVVYSGEVGVLEEMAIEDAYALLKELEVSGRIRLYYYPDRPFDIPADDSDIVVKAAHWTKKWPPTKEAFLKLHPHLKDQFEVVFASLKED